MTLLQCGCTLMMPNKQLVWNRCAPFSHKMFHSNWPMIRALMAAIRDHQKSFFLSISNVRLFDRAAIAYNSSGITAEGTELN